MNRHELRDRLATQQESWFSLSPRHHLDPIELELDRKRIEAYYHAHGYFRARVKNLEVTHVGANSVDVRFVIEEGPPTKINQVTLGGLPPAFADARAVRSSFDLARGQQFDYGRFIAATDRLGTRLRALGYPFARVDRQAQVDRDESTAAIIVNLDPGPKAHIARIDIPTQVPGVSAAQLRIHTGLHPGQLATAQMLDEARGNLYNLGIFSVVRARWEQVGDDAAAVIDLHEGPLRELRLCGGVGIESQRNEVRLRAIYLRRNFLGGLRTLRLDVEPAWVSIPSFWNIARQGPEARVEGQFIQPDLLLPLDQLKLTVGYDLGIDYAYQYHGPRGQVAWLWRLWHSRVQLVASYNAELLLFFNTDPTILQDPALARRLFGFTDPYRLTWLQQDVSLDLRDRPLDARRGVYLGFSAEEGGNWIGSGFRYEKLTPEVRGYLPLGSHVVVAARLLYGRLFVQGDLGSPITRRYYMGGPDSHRGFNYDRLSLQVPSLLPGVPPLPLGGDEQFLVQGELRVGLLPIKGYWLELGIFLDGGDVSAPSCATGGSGASTCAPVTGTVPAGIDLAELHWATGAGLRYHTVLGVIRADLGIRLNRLSPMEADGRPNPDPGERYVFHLSIGEPF